MQQGKGGSSPQSVQGLGQLVPDASGSRPQVQQEPLQNLIPSLRVGLLVLQASLDAAWLQPGSRLVGQKLRSCVRWVGRGSTRSWPLLLGDAFAPALPPGPCLSDAAAMSEPGHVPCWSQPADLNPGFTVDLSHPTDMSGDLACCRLWLPSLNQLYLPCSALSCQPCWLPGSWLTFPLGLLPNVLPSTGSHSDPLLKTSDATLQGGFKNHLKRYKNIFCTSKVHF